MNKQQLIIEANTLIQEVEARLKQSSAIKRAEQGQLLILWQNADSLLNMLQIPEKISPIEYIRKTDLFLETCCVLYTLADMSPSKLMIAISPLNQEIINSAHLLVEGLQYYGGKIVKNIHPEIVQFQTALAQLHTELEQSKRRMYALDALKAKLDALHTIDITDVNALNQEALVFLKELMAVKQAAETPEDIDFIYRVQAYSDPLFSALSRMSPEFPTLKTIQNEEDLSKSIAATAASTTALLAYAKGKTRHHSCTPVLGIEAFQAALRTWELNFQDTTLLDTQRTEANEALRQAYVEFETAISTPAAQALINQNQGLTKALNAIIITANALLWLIGLNGFQEFSREKEISSIADNLSLFKCFTESEDVAVDGHAASCSTAA